MLFWLTKRKRPTEFKHHHDYHQHHHHDHHDHHHGQHNHQYNHHQNHHHHRRHHQHHDDGDLQTEEVEGSQQPWGKQGFQCQPARTQPRSIFPRRIGSFCVSRKKYIGARKNTFLRIDKYCSFGSFSCIEGRHPWQSVRLRRGHCWLSSLLIVSK